MNLPVGTRRNEYPWILSAGNGKVGLDKYNVRKRICGKCRYNIWDDWQLWTKSPLIQALVNSKPFYCGWKSGKAQLQGMRGWQFSTNIKWRGWLEGAWKDSKREENMRMEPRRFLVGYILVREVSIESEATWLSGVRSRWETTLPQQVLGCSLFLVNWNE